MIPSNAFKESIPHFLEPIALLLDDSSISEIMINGPGEIWIERGGRLERTQCAFPSRRELDAALTNIAQYADCALGAKSPILEAHLPDGSRIEAVLPPLSENGPIVAIRRFRHSALTIEKLVESGSLTAEAAQYLAEAVLEKRNVVVAGGTGSGKTSLLGALSTFVPDDERIVVLEDTREIRLPKPHVVYLETRAADERGKGRVTMRDLLRATLRLRPDRILVGEVRGAEALDLIQAMTSGHGGSMTTAHAASAQDTLRRLETMAMMDSLDLPLFALRAQLASAVQLVVQVSRGRDGKRRISAIDRVGGLGANGDYAISPVFACNQQGCLFRLDAQKGEQG